MPDGPDPTAQKPDAEPDAKPDTEPGTEPMKITKDSPLKMETVDEPSPPGNGTSEVSGVGQGEDTKGSPRKPSKEQSSDKKGEDGKREASNGRDRRSRSPTGEKGDRHRRRKEDRSSHSTTRRDDSPRRSSRRSSSRDRSRRDRDRDRSRERRRGRRSSRSRSRSHGSRKRSRRSSERRRDRSTSRSKKRRSRSTSKDRRKRRSRSDSSKKSRSPSPLVRRPAAKAPEPAAPTSRPATLWDQPPPAPQPSTTQPLFAQQPSPLAAILASNPALAQLVGTLNASATPGGQQSGLAASLLTNLMSMQQAAATPVAAPLLINGVPVTPQQLRQARRLYVGNVPPQANEATLMTLFNQALVDSGKADPSNPPVIAVQLELGKSFAFIELRTPEDASTALLLDGIALGPHFLKVRRPKDFKPLPGQAPDAPGGGVPVIRGVVSTTVPDSEHKVYLGGIPTALNEMQVRELVSAFGELKAFNLVRDASTNISKGYSFFEYWDHAVTDRVCAELNGFELGGRKLTCQRANTQVPRSQQGVLNGVGFNPLMTGLLQANMLGGMVPGAFGIPGLSLPGVAQPVAAGPPTRVIKLSNMIVPAELNDDDEYAEILSDIKEETSKYGTVLSLKVPRPTKLPDGQVVQGPGVGQVYVEFEQVDGAKAAEVALRNRCFSGRIVVVAFYPEADYAQQNLH